MPLLATSRRRKSSTRRVVGFCPEMDSCAELLPDLAGLLPARIDYAE